ncbi:hypothetical protein C8Q74DRAFT_1221612 [Fomes fomentarius]|nr:hypothetical protein C8Q74DRAFT_1221612 [Fomes fomentarius]
MSNLSSASFNAAFQYEVRREINAPIEKVWSILTDVQSYPECRSAQMVDASSHQPTTDPTLRPGTLGVAMAIPATLDPAKQPTVQYEQLTVLDGAKHQIVWGGGRIPSLFRAETAQALSTADGKTVYELRALVGGVSGHLFKLIMSASMRSTLDDMADALKQRAEI